ncbi:methyltransferase domain-containing protein [Frankia sp. AgB32]|uniref:methyltransferase domain-containing protein n=1 Tax=Frankia sp. AgB32 TaxID=631119 RepID=UPI00200F08BD|nr:methyltransferase domain-containing protein [Frankia sp. AgB32]MCK9894205.1 methyltransferase domain-containing protein [Frankia sp. AgB32]
MQPSPTSDHPAPVIDRTVPSGGRTLREPPFDGPQVHHTSTPAAGRRPPARHEGPAASEARVLAVVDGPDTADYTDAADYVAHTATLRGVVRQRLVTRALIEHLPPAPARLIDIGGGNGVQAMEFARRGYDVTVCEPDSRMLAEARRVLAGAPESVRRRVELVQGDGRDAVRLVGTGWDATFCHGVIMFVPEPAPLLNVLVELTRPGGIVSVVGKNGPALALRAGLQSRWQDTAALLDEPGFTAAAGPGRQPTVPLPPGDDPANVAAILTAAGTRPLAWYGIRTFTDHLGDLPPGPDVDTVVDAEWAAGARDPYRGIARLIHHVHRRTE